LAWDQEAAQLLPALVLGGGTLCGLQVLRASMGRDDRCEIRELLGLQGQALIAGLARLQRTGCPLA
jgi:hypothetical protein